jgi:hypothetical protein
MELCKRSLRHIAISLLHRGHDPANSTTLQACVSRGIRLATLRKWGRCIRESLRGIEVLKHPHLHALALDFARIELGTSRCRHTALHSHEGAKLGDLNFANLLAR